MLYSFYAMNRWMMDPVHLMSEASRAMLAPLAYSGFPPAKGAFAGLEILSRMTQRYDKPSFGLSVQEEVVWERPFCRMLRFASQRESGKSPRIFLVAPLSGHYATLLREMVACLVARNEVFITDWTCASQVPLQEGDFGVDTYTDYLMDMLGHLHEDDPERPVHAVAVCQPCPQLLAAAAVMAEEKNPARPASMTLMAGPIDPAAAPTQVTELADGHPISWFRRHAIHQVPLGQAGAGRRVYPGYLQLMGFMAMNPDRHIEQHVNLFYDRLHGREEKAAKVVDFYDEYFATLDLDAPFYLETVERVFQRREIAVGDYHHNGALVKPEAIKDIALLTVEGERDDISAPGQTLAAQELCSGLPKSLKSHYLQEGAGHYGCLAGRRFRTGILPRLEAFFEAHNTPRKALAKA